MDCKNLIYPKLAIVDIYISLRGRLTEVTRRCTVKSIRARNLHTASHLGKVLMKLEEYAESEAILRETLVLQREVLGPEHQETKVTATNLQALISNGDATVQTMPSHLSFKTAKFNLP